MDFVLKRKTNRRPVSQAHMVLWCHGGRDVGAGRVRRVRSATGAASRKRKNTWRVHVRAVTYATSVKQCGWLPSRELLSLSGGGDDDDGLLVCGDGAVSQKSSWARLAATTPRVFVTCKKSLILDPSLGGPCHRTCADHQRGCVGRDDNINTIVRTHVYAHITPMQLCGVQSRWEPSAEHYKTLGPSDRV